MQPPAPPAYHERQSRQLCLRHTLNNLLQLPAFTAADLDSLADSLTPPSLLGLSPHRTPLLGNYDVSVLEMALARVGKALVWVPLPSRSAARGPPLAAQPRSQPAPPSQPHQGHAQEQEPPLAPAARPAPPTAADLQPPPLPPPPRQHQHHHTRADRPASTGASCGEPRGAAAGPDRALPYIEDGLPADLLSRPGLWAVILNVRQRPWLASALGVPPSWAGGRHWLGLRRFGDSWFNLDSHLPAPVRLGPDSAARAVVLAAVRERDALVLLAVEGGVDAVGAA